MLPPKTSFARKYWFVFFGIFLFLMLLATQLFQAITPEQKRDNTWNNITPGISTQNTVYETLGNPKTTRQIGGVQLLEYPSGPRSIYTHIYIGEDQRVLAIQERLNASNPQSLESFINLYGNPDLKMDDPSTNGSTVASVYLQVGLVVFSHIKGGVVEKLWYIEPSNEYDFRAMWAEYFTDVNKENQGHVNYSEFIGE